MLGSSLKPTYLDFAKVRVYYNCPVVCKLSTYVHFELKLSHRILYMYLHMSIFLQTLNPELSFLVQLELENLHWLQLLLERMSIATTAYFPFVMVSSHQIVQKVQHMLPENFWVWFKTNLMNIFLTFSITVFSVIIPVGLFLKLFFEHGEY